MSGGKGGKQETKIPDWLETRAQSFMDRADRTAKLGYAPYYGPDVAAINPMEAQAMQNSVAAADAFGLGGGIDPMAGMPEAQEFAGGVRGYSSAPLFEQALGSLQERAPGYMDSYNEMFNDPAPGAQGQYYDPNNPMDAEILSGERAPEGAYPPGYEWLRFLDMNAPSSGRGFL